MSKLSTLLYQLGKNAELAIRFEKEPHQVMRDHQLNDDEVSAMLARDIESLKGLSGSANAKVHYNVQVP